MAGKSKLKFQASVLVVDENGTEVTVRVNFAEPTLSTINVGGWSYGERRHAAGQIAEKVVESMMYRVQDFMFDANQDDHLRHEADKLERKQAKWLDALDAAGLWQRPEDGPFELHGDDA